MSDRALRVAVALLALAGTGIAAYLTYAWYAEATIACTTGGCETVQSSSYAKLAGLPVPVLGLVGYLGILATALVPGEPSAGSGGRARARRPRVQRLPAPRADLRHRRVLPSGAGQRPRDAPPRRGDRRASARSSARAGVRLDRQPCLAPGVDSTDHVGRAREADGPQERGREARRIPLAAEQDHVRVERELRIVRPHARVEPPVHDRQRVVKRAGDDNALRRRSSSERTSTSTAPAAAASCASAA